MVPAAPTASALARIDPGTVHAPPLERIEAAGKFFRGRESGEHFFIRGLTYGPFQGAGLGDSYPDEAGIARDLELIVQAGANLLRVYHPPPERFVQACRQRGVRLLISIPWPQQFDFWNNRELRAEAEHTVRDVVQRYAGDPVIFGYLVANEINTQLVRWIGDGRVKHFLERLMSIGKEADPNALFAYANYPSTEYLQPRTGDFNCFNVYLHEPAKLERYLLRLQNLAGNQPLILGEVGMDTIRHSQGHQRELIENSLRSAARCGLAGEIIFSFTDEWFSNGEEIMDWAFGVVDRERKPKEAWDTLRQLWPGYQNRPLLSACTIQPRVSVLICAYNAASTLENCLQSLTQLRYPDHEVILVDDGSTDDTAQIAQRFPGVRYERIDHLGLSAARNRGAELATGEVIAYTDADCEVDPFWLDYLTDSLCRTGATGVGGPNIPPPSTDSRLAAIAAAPGGPSQVMFTDQIAEHIPGCNMAFWKWAFLEIDGFDPVFQTAGDDVDFCWRLQAAGHTIVFSPGAMVWHHRRFTTGAYLKQQRGYGRAESLLRLKHIEKFGRTGKIHWRGQVYENLRGLTAFLRPHIYYGIFGRAPFQAVYESPGSSWRWLAGSLDWLFLSVFAIILQSLAGAFPWLGLIMLLLPVFLWTSYLCQARLPAAHDSLANRKLVATLALLQPWTRGWGRIRQWLSLRQVNLPALRRDLPPNPVNQPSPSSAPLEFWSEDGVTRDALLSHMIAELRERHWPFAAGTGWKRWDLLLFGDSRWNLALHSVTEFPGGPKGLTKVRLNTRPTLKHILFTAGGLALLSALLMRPDLADSTFWQATTWLCAALFALDQIRALFFNRPRLKNLTRRLLSHAAQKAELWRG